MSEHELTPPLAEDDFPEFAAPPQHRPPQEGAPQSRTKADGRQDGVDQVLERLRRERDEGRR